MSEGFPNMIPKFFFFFFFNWNHYIEDLTTTARHGEEGKDEKHIEKLMININQSIKSINCIVF